LESYFYEDDVWNGKYAKRNDWSPIFAIFSKKVSGGRNGGVAWLGWGGQSALIYKGGGGDLRRYPFGLQGAFPGWALLGGVIFG